MSLRTLDGVDVAGRRVLVRVDLNVPMAQGQVTDDSRLTAARSTIERLRKAGARVILLSHLGRPKGAFAASMSLAPLAAPLARAIGAPVAFVADCVGPTVRTAVEAMAPGDVLLLENVRFHPGEEANTTDFAQALARSGDLYVDDAFSAAHRAHASTEGIAHLLPAYAGEAMRRELAALDMALGHPARPVMGLIGGSKVSTKLGLLRRLAERLDTLAIVGGMANTFLMSQGWDVASSLCERDLAGEARAVTTWAQTHGCEILIPTDVVVAKEANGGAAARTRRMGEIEHGERILDVGPESVARLCTAMDEVRTLVWNGPLGVFESPPFDRATTAVARHAASLVKARGLVAVAGGGDTAAALKHAGVAQDFTYISTAGGAFLQWMEGKPLPGVTVLEEPATAGATP